MDLMRFFLQKEEIRKNPLMLQEELDQAAWFLLGDIAARLDVIKVFDSSLKHPPTTKDMAQEGVRIAHEKGYKVIFVLAFPFIHRFLCWYFVKKYAKPYNIRVEIIKTGYIPFDQNSDQWLARGPVRLICYTILRACGIRWL